MGGDASLGCFARWCDGKVVRLWWGGRFDGSRLVGGGEGWWRGKFQCPVPVLPRPVADNGETSGPDFPSTYGLLVWLTCCGVLESDLGDRPPRGARAGRQLGR